MSEIRIELDNGVIDRELSAAGWVGTMVREVTEAVEASARARCPGNGPLRASIQSEITDRPGEVLGEVFSDLDYARYVHEGTGVYGPRRRPIRPVRRQVLTWRDLGSGERVFARQVEGQRPRPFLMDGLLAASPWPVRRD
ncbi:HK97 gp10 family phage protein [Streptomyces sp. MP131-18]|uniref:HK97 gp10 family phage protein n=1 Tax=Streptomyces sp. MP131-18 TaxID=1857892 RepID=UPI00097C371A|nr:HK97 gp10 family phage protein [Streptomyces sp. MP131-18]ONK13137.1 hypothetical protein STBA_38990 [Streptomyces sp. MP131-18]